MKTKLMIGLLLAASSVFGATGVFFGIGVGGGGYRSGYYAAPPPVAAYVTPRPGPGYVWVPGYWAGIGPRLHWRAGYWAPPRYYRPHYVRPRHWDRHHRDRDDYYYRYRR
jgi:hypothetical protein